MLTVFKIEDDKDSVPKLTFGFNCVCVFCNLDTPVKYVLFIVFNNWLLKDFD